MVQQSDNGFTKMAYRTALLPIILSYFVGQCSLLSALVDEHEIINDVNCNFSYRHWRYYIVTISYVHSNNNNSNSEEMEHSDVITKNH